MLEANTHPLPDAIARAITLIRDFQSKLGDYDCDNEIAAECDAVIEALSADAKAAHREREPRSLISQLSGSDLSELADAVVASLDGDEETGGDAEEGCESGDPDCGPVTHHDSDGVPLCEECWDALEVDVLAVARRYLADHALPAHGVVLVFDDKAYGWKDKLRNPDHERPGALAVAADGSVFVARGGNEYHGAREWRDVTARTSAGIAACGAPSAGAGQ